MKVNLSYGRELVAVEVPEEALVLLPNHKAPAAPQTEIIAQALTQPLESPPLGELACGRKSAIILIPCRTRRPGSSLYVPAIVKELTRAGMPQDRIIVYTSTGTHDNFRTEDEPLLIGEAAGHVRVMGHDCDTESKLAEVGTTSRGNRVVLSRQYLDADLKIATGRVNYHYFAGFSAGRKAVLPGVAAKGTILRNHAMTILRDGDIRLNADACNGSLEKNPVHLDMLEAAKMAPPDFTFCTVCNASNEVTHAFAGDMELSHEKAVEVVRGMDSPRVSEPVDFLIVSGGGAPYDVDMVQAIKALLNNYHIVRPGGCVVWLAECPEGSPEWLRQSCAIEDFNELKASIRENKIRQPHNALMLRRACEHATVFMVTSMRDEVVKSFGFRKATSVSEAMASAAAILPAAPRVAVIPYGNVTVARL